MKTKHKRNGVVSDYHSTQTIRFNIEVDTLKAINELKDTTGGSFSNLINTLLKQAIANHE